ncbi:YtxH domain-containing protein [Hymenobacter psychrophilus]|uniref:YtxH-like protein n=1 Tax=Hymenobacter psychrophilus TaxID=651662 RepID=A0A1H3H001_9BACT|nr:YtxH domain-containing protein [Hymenobacter psychrophilus]SDY08801.1 YtxH-like protein [Hymenobacter psychrophilus]
MQDTKGKVIFSLLAGATAGIVAGLLLAPETGDEARADIKESAGKLNKDLAKLLKEGKARLDSFTGKAPVSSGQQNADRTAADDLLSSMNQPNGPSTDI